MAKLNANTIVVNPATSLPEALYKGDSLPAWAKDLVGEHLLEDGDSNEDKGLAGLTVKELQAEVDKRNEGREDDAKVSPESDRKADLIAALEADNQAQA